MPRHHPLVAMRANIVPFPAIILAAALLFVAAQTPAAARRTEYNFNADWKLKVGDGDGWQSPALNDADWETVTLPHAWNEDEAFRVSIAEHSTGIAWYRKRFTLPADAAGKKVYLEFEGVRQAAEVYLNGNWISLHENGAMAFGIDITERVLPPPSENVVAVRTNNDWNYQDATGTRYQWADRNFNANYGGIPKNVALHITDRLHQTLPLYSFLKTTGVYVYATDFDIPGRIASIHAESEVRNDHSSPRFFDYDVSVTDMEGTVVARFGGPTTMLAPGETTNVRATARVGDLQFWSWGYGYLYNVATTLKVDGEPVDTVVTRTGFRKTATRDGMFLLNDRVLQIKGYAQRTSNEWPAVGLPSAPWLSDFSNRMIVEGNGNTVRWMHITPAKQDVESCDRVGLMMLLPAGDAESDTRGRQWEQRVELMRDAVIYNRNNPSVVFLEGGNEAISEEHMAELKALRDQYDPHGGRLSGCREMLDSKVAEWGGEMLYINKSADIPLFATEYSRDEGLRKYWDEFSPPFHKDGDGPLYRNAPAPDYNRNQDSHAVENVVRWFDYWEARPGTGRRVSAGGLNIIFSDTNTHYRGAENYRRSGEVDPMRIPKDGYFAHRAMWDGWVATELHHAHIVGHWNYAPDTIKPVRVVSSADRVELFLDGASLGFGQRSSRFLFTFPNILWKPGVLRAVGFDAAGAPLCSAECRTAGAPALLRLTSWTDPRGLRADGADLALVQVEVTDADGNRCPTAMNTIDFALEGPAEWRGGIAQGPDNHILATSLPVECGVNRVLIRSTPQPGTVRLAARSPGLESAFLELASLAAEVSGGLSTDLPGVGLSSYLDRGPTPAGPSYAITRWPVAVAGATAGSNADQVELSLDDNELTRWENDGALASAWITFRFDEPQVVNQVVLKLQGWRTTGYPIRLIAGGRTLWSRETPRSLGYVTLTFDAVETDSLTIALDGVTRVADAFGQIVEVGGAVDQADETARGRLAIVEAEFYGPLAND